MRLGYRSEIGAEQSNNRSLLRHSQTRKESVAPARCVEHETCPMMCCAVARLLRIVGSLDTVGVACAGVLSTYICCNVQCHFLTYYSGRACVNADSVVIIIQHLDLYERAWLTGVSIVEHRFAWLIDSIDADASIVILLSSGFYDMRDLT